MQSLATHNKNPIVPYLAGVLVAAATYWALAKAGLRFGALLHPYVSPVWPSAGFALALILVHGYRFWPAIFIGALAVNLELGATLPVAGGIAAANAFSSVFAVYLLRRFADFQPQFARLRDAVSLILVAALACRALCAILGTGALWAGGMVAEGEFWTLWLNRWIGGAVGVLVMAPFFLAFAEPVERSREAKWYAEALVLLVLVAAAGAFVFTPLQPSAHSRYPLAFIPLPFVIWAAVRFEVRGASVASLALASISLLGTLQGHGPFALLPRHEAVLLLAIYNGLVAATGLLVAGAVGEMRRERSLRAGLEVLRQVFDLLPVGVWITDERGRISASNPAGRRIWGGERQLVPKQYGEFKGWRLPDRTPIEAHDWALARALEKSESRIGEEIEIEGFDGARRVIRNSAMPLRDAQSRIAGAIAIHEDITGMKAAEFRRAEHQRLQRDALVREVHHRIKNHLQGVAGLLERHAVANPALEPVIEEVLGQLNVLATVHGLQSEFPGRELNLCNIARGIVEALQVVSIVPLEFVLAEGLVPIEMNADEAVPIALILNELVSNAVKHVAPSAKQAAVKIEMKRDGVRAVIVVRNAPARLPPGFDFAGGRSLGTGLRLAKSLLPGEGARLSFSQPAADVVESVLELWPPVLNHATDSVSAT